MVWYHRALATEALSTTSQNALLPWNTYHRLLNEIFSSELKNIYYHPIFLAYTYLHVYNQFDSIPLLKSVH